MLFVVLVAGSVGLPFPEDLSLLGAGALAQPGLLRLTDVVLAGLAGVVTFFFRLGWNDGATESFACTEAERTVSLGAQIAGDPWGPADDRFGVGVAANGLRSGHAAHLRAGGLGFLLGDGRLGYRPETILGLPDPGYNRDRGPVSIVSLRLHLEELLSRE